MSGDTGDLSESGNIQPNVNHTNNTDDRFGKQPLDYEIDLIRTDHQAYDWFVNHDQSSLEHAFTVANILHRNQKPYEAAVIYGMAYRIHSKAVDEYPLSEVLMHVRLLCFLKAGKELPEDNLEEMRRSSEALYNYICGIRLSWREARHEDALKKIDNSFEEFLSGEEIDRLYLGVIKYLSRDIFAVDCDNDVPNTIFMYWDKEPPEEIVGNFKAHNKIKEFQIEILNQESACEFLYKFYGKESRDLFLAMRHPAEAADFLRIHVTNIHGGWWLDADAAVTSKESLAFMRKHSDGSVLFTTDGNVIHNDFYATTRYSTLMNECINILYNNCYKHKHLYIAYKTGPGVFNRALSRIAYRRILGLEDECNIKLFSQAEFENVVEQIDAKYKSRLPLWQNA